MKFINMYVFFNNVCIFAQAMIKRVSTQFIRQGSILATALDPRFKRMKTVPAEMAALSSEYLRDACNREYDLLFAAGSIADAVERKESSPSQDLPPDEFHNFDDEVIYVSFFIHMHFGTLMYCHSRSGTWRRGGRR